MTTPYVSVPQVKTLLRSSYDGSDDDALSSLIRSASAFLDKYCNRANGGFLSQTYDELYHGTGETIMFLRQIPIQTINRIATTQLPALSIHNTDTDMGCRATVQIVGTPNNSVNLNNQYTSTGIVLTYVKNAVTTTNTLTWATYPTVTQLQAAIAALGNNWTANVQGGFGSWSSTDLRATQGAFGARITTTYLWIHWFDLPIYRVDESIGEVYSPMGFARGLNNWRVIYTAGYSVFPDDLGQALCELVANSYYARELNSNLQQETLGPVNYTQFVREGFEGMSILAQKTINRHRVPSIDKFSCW